MSFRLKDVFFLLGILWATTLPPGTTANLSQDHTGDPHPLTYDMADMTTSRKLKCSTGEGVLMPPGRKNKARGLTCTGANNITVPLYSRSCSTKPKKLTITVNSDEAVIIEFRDNMTGKEMIWQKEPIESEKEGQISNTTGDGKLILPLDTSKESGLYSFSVNDAEPFKKLNSYCTVAVIRRGCPANRHGDGCQKWCPDCMYGGICHDKTGTCVCPPGRTGDLCEEECSPSTETQNSCIVDIQAVKDNVQACLPSPYGCSCFPGQQGDDCDTGCDENHWGVNCLQTCNHCESNKCNHETGACVRDVKHCAKPSKGYLRFRELPLVDPDEDRVLVSFNGTFDGEKPESDDVKYQVIVWEKDQDMSNPTNLKDTDTIESPVKIDNLNPATDYFAAVLVKFTPRGSDTPCLIDGTLRGERIQKTPFTTKCPEGGKINITVKGISDDGFNISWVEEAYARKCNYTYRIRIKETSEKKEVFDQVVGTPFHHNGLKSYTNYTVSVQTKSGERDSGPVVVTIKTNPKIPVPPNVTYEETRDVITFRWRTPSDAQGVIRYNYSYEVKPIACDRETDSQSNSTTDTEVSFSKPSHYANVTFLLAIGNEAGFSEPGKLTFTSSSKVPEVEVKEIQCENNTRPSYCLVTLEDNCTKVNGKDLDIDIELEYTTNSAKNPMTSRQKTENYRPVNNSYMFNVTFPEGLYNHTNYRLKVFVINDEGRNDTKQPTSLYITTPPVAPGSVTIKSAKSAHSSIEIAWDPPTSWPPTGDIERYRIDVYEEDQGNASINGFPIFTNNKSYFISKLKPGVSYTIKVFAKNVDVNETGVPAVRKIKTVSKKPLHPTNIQDNSSPTEVFITWDDHKEDEDFDLNYTLTFQNTTHHIHSQMHLFTGLQPEQSYPLTITSCNEWKCSDNLIVTISTKPRQPVIEGQVEVLEYSGNVSKMRLPQVKNPPAVQYVVVVETAENLDDGQLKELSVMKVKDYIEEQRDSSSYRVHKRSTTQSAQEAGEPKAWVSGIYQITNTTVKDIEVGTGVGEDQALEDDKDYQIVAVTEKKSGPYSEFAVSNPVSAKGVAATS